MKTANQREISSTAESGLAVSALAFCLLLLFLLGCGPIGPIPGGALSGEVVEGDITDWSFADDVETAQLETRPSDPHSVNCWFAVVGEALYVPTSMILGPKEPEMRSWVAHVADDPQVRIRLGRIVIDRVASRVEEGAEFDLARLALEKRYGIAMEDRDPERVIWIYRLEARL